MNLSAVRPDLTAVQVDAVGAGLSVMGAAGAPALDDADGGRWSTRRAVCLGSVIPDRLVQTPVASVEVSASVRTGRVEVGLSTFQLRSVLPYPPADILLPLCDRTDDWTSGVGVRWLSSWALGGGRADGGARGVVRQ